MKCGQMSITVLPTLKKELTPNIKSAKLELKIHLIFCSQIDDELLERLQSAKYIYYIYKLIDLAVDI